MYQIDFNFVPHLSLTTKDIYEISIPTCGFEFLGHLLMETFKYQRIINVLGWTFCLVSLLFPSAYFQEYCTNKQTNKMSSTDSRIVICEVKDTCNLKLLNTTDDLNKYPRARESTGDFLETQVVKKLPAMQDTLFRSLGQKDPLEKEMATRFSILAWRIPWTEKPGITVHGVTNSHTPLCNYHFHF